MTRYHVEHRAITYGQRDGRLLGTYEIKAATPLEAKEVLLRAYEGYDGTTETLTFRVER